MPWYFRLRTRGGPAQVRARCRRTGTTDRTSFSGREVNEHRRCFERRTDPEPDLVGEKFELEIEEGTACLLTPRKIDRGRDDVVAVGQPQSYGGIGSDEFHHVLDEERSPLVATASLF